MNRREFARTTSVVAATVAIAPKMMAKALPSPHEFDERVYLEDCGCTPEQIAAIMRMYEGKKRIQAIFAEVAKEFPQTVPDGSDEEGWRHGEFRISGRVGGYDESSFGWAPFHKNTNLLRVEYFCFWRRAVRSKHTNELKHFASWGIADADSKCVFPGQTVTVHEDVKIDDGDEKISQFARQSFVKLQELVTEFYNREAE